MLINKAKHALHSYGVLIIFVNSMAKAFYSLVKQLKLFKRLWKRFNENIARSLLPPKISNRRKENGHIYRIKTYNKHGYLVLRKDAKNDHIAAGRLDHLCIGIIDHSWCVEQTDGDVWGDRFQIMNRKNSHWGTWYEGCKIIFPYPWHFW